MAFSEHRTATHCAVVNQHLSGLVAGTPSAEVAPHPDATLHDQAVRYPKALFPKRQQPWSALASGLG